jgi:hypothetical protein
VAAHGLDLGYRESVKSLRQRALRRIGIVHAQSVLRSRDSVLSAISHQLNDTSGPPRTARPRAAGDDRAPSVGR